MAIEKLETRYRELLNTRSSIQTRIEMKVAELKKEVEVLEAAGVELTDIDAEILRLENEIDAEEETLTKDFNEIESFFDEVLEVIK